MTQPRQTPPANARRPAQQASAQAAPQPGRQAAARPPRPAPEVADGKTPQRVLELRNLCRVQLHPTLAKLLPKTADVERFSRVFLNTLESDSDLWECSNTSVARAILHSATVGLEIGGPYPHAYAFARWNKHKQESELQFQISVWGYLELIRRTGFVLKVWGDVIRANDHYEPISGTEGKSIIHRPDWFAGDEVRGDLIGSYACALLQNRETVFEPVSGAELKAAEDSNRADSPAWRVWRDQMAIKVALKRLQKYLPKHSLLDDALAIDEGLAMPVVDTVAEAVEAATVAGSRPALPMPTNAGDVLQSAVFAAKAEAAAAKAQAPRAAAASAPGSVPPPANDAGAAVDRAALLQLLTDVDERYADEAARVAGWSERDALAVLSFVNAALEGDEPLPPKPGCMRLDD